MSASAGRALILVENLSVPFDRRVWQESLALRGHGYDVVVVCPRGENRDREAHVRLEGVEIHRYPLRPARGGRLGFLREYATALWHSYRLSARLGPFDVVQV